jgi:hypothetical protein
LPQGSETEMTRIIRAALTSRAPNADSGNTPAFGDSEPRVVLPRRRAAGQWFYVVCIVA